MEVARKSNDGNCPSCKGGHWQTLKALALTQRGRVTATTTGPRPRHRRATAGAVVVDAALQYAPPVRPGDYDQMGTYRRWCEDTLLAAQQKLAKIDAASRDPGGALPGLFKVGPDDKRISFQHFAGKLERLTRYDAELALWEATKLCLRCATTFIDADRTIPPPTPPVFRFPGQERRCTSCSSYYWKDPAAIADHWESVAARDLAKARSDVAEALASEQAAARVAPRPGWVGKLRAVFATSKSRVPAAQARVEQAERALKDAVERARLVREASHGTAGVRWCVECQCTYICPQIEA